jgi:hypothetical protein
MKVDDYQKLLLTSFVASFLMLAVLIAMTKQMNEVACTGIGGLMTILTVFLWKEK